MFLGLEAHTAVQIIIQRHVNGLDSSDDLDTCMCRKQGCVLWHKCRSKRRACLFKP